MQSAHTHLALRHRIAQLDPVQGATRRAVFTLGADRIDNQLGGGLLRGALHEIFAAKADDGSAATAYAVILALRACADQPVIWVRDSRVERLSGQLYGPGLVELGANPERFIIVSASSDIAVLRAAADSVKCKAVGAVIIEPYGKAASFDLTVTRRLGLASASSGVLTLLLRIGAEPGASAAQTRWRVAAAPSLALPANAPGISAFDLSLLRHRGGIAEFDARLEWNRDQLICAEQQAPRTHLPRGLPAFSVFGTDQAKAA